MVAIIATASALRMLAVRRTFMVANAGIGFVRRDLIHEGLEIGFVSQNEGLEIETMREEVEPTDRRVPGLVLDLEV